MILVPSTIMTGTAQTKPASSSNDNALDDDGGGSLPSIVRDIIRHVFINTIIVSFVFMIMCIVAMPLYPLDGMPSTSYMRASVKWSTAQLIKSIFASTFADGELWGVADNWEASAWTEWERITSRSRSSVELSQLSQSSSVLEMPVLDLRTCNARSDDAINTCSSSRPSLSEVKRAFGDDFLSRPLLLRGIWTEEQLADPNRRLSLDGMQQHADLATLAVPYYADATKSGYSALKPSGVAPLRDIVSNITNHQGKQKIGSQVLVETYPSLIEEVAPIEVVTAIFGNHFHSDSVKGSGPFRVFPAWTTVPVFLAGSEVALNAATDGDISTNETEQNSMHPRTDLHCEPIGNVAVQLHGSKMWTLVPSEQSVLLKPSVSRHGRAFYFSNLDPLDPTVFSSIPHYTVTTNAGDALWVPPWMWHRVDYLNIVNEATKAEPALAASLFHFRPVDFLANNPLFAFLLVPNLVKELLGRNTE